jgi:hypothetical protein
MLKEKELKQIIGPILKKKLSRSGLESFSLESGEDHDGDPALFINARFRALDKQFDAASYVAALGDIREILRKRSDPRLPYIRFQPADESHEAIDWSRPSCLMSLLISPISVRKGD